MKKILAFITLSSIIIACSNSSDSGAATSPAAVDSDTVSKTVPPPVTLDTPTVQSDTAKVKKAMRK